MAFDQVVVCSFYTNDDYYRSHADQLRENLDALGLTYELQEVTKAQGEEWPDICRKKIPFLAEVCTRHPDKKVFWIDVDCQLNDMPTMVSDFSADLLGFQRGFGSPLGIGYEKRTRFWEPCFFGINATQPARQFIADAAALEDRAEIRATDDYFFEEAWRANAQRMSFQVIPSTCVESRASGVSADHPAFFSFGASGNVAEFKGKVVQHDRLPGARSLKSSVRRLMRGVWRTALRGAKAIEQRLPAGASFRLRNFADSVGLTRLIAPSKEAALQLAGSPLGASPHRRHLVAQMLTAGQGADVERVNELFIRLSSTQIPTVEESAARAAAQAFAVYASHPEDSSPIHLNWWARPFPGNFGDWLSPLVVSRASQRAVVYVSGTSTSTMPHLVAIGSIGRFVKPSSIVVGTGLASVDFQFESSARFVSVRGPITARHLADCGGPSIESHGDPALLLARLFPLQRGATNGRLALVRHTTHTRISLTLPDEVDELSVLMADPDSIQTFLAALMEYDGVVTSAMHVMIACHSYGIPCALVGFKGFESAVPGIGAKYEDYSLGAGLQATYRPMVLGRDLRKEALRDRLSQEIVSAAKLDEISHALDRGIEMYNEAHVCEQSSVLNR